MAEGNEILNTLQILVDYYGKEPTEAQARLYLQTLDDIPADFLTRAALAWIQRSPFFPKVNELRKLAGDLYVGEAQPRSDILGARAVIYEDAFYQDGVLDVEAWERLITDLESVNRSARANQVRRKFLHIQSIYKQRTNVSSQSSGA